MKISLIAAVAQNGVIGRKNNLPWHLPDDSAFFKRMTSHHAIVMGRKSLDALGKPLPNRTNIIITRNTKFTADGVVIVHTLDDAIDTAKQSSESKHHIDEVFVIGGAEIYALALSMATNLYLTEIQRDYEGDAYFPAFDKADWQEVSRIHHPADDRHETAFDFVEYVKV